MLTKGAVMSFENKHGMKTDGEAGPGVWNQLLADVAAGSVDTDAYNLSLIHISEPTRPY